MKKTQCEPCPNCHHTERTVPESPFRFFGLVKTTGPQDNTWQPNDIPLYPLRPEFCDQCGYTWLFQVSEAEFRGIRL